MFISFFESIKYVGHLWPIALLRIYVGYFFLTSGISKIENHFLTSAALQTTIQSWIQSGNANERYLVFLQHAVLTHWQLFSYLVVTAEMAVGLSFILGFMVRPAALVAVFLNLNFMLAGGPDAQISKIFAALNASLFLIAAGRCFGFDYYFFKKIRGFWL